MTNISVDSHMTYDHWHRCILSGCWANKTPANYCATSMIQNAVTGGLNAALIT